MGLLEWVAVAGLTANMSALAWLMKTTHDINVRLAGHQSDFRLLDARLTALERMWMS